MRFILKKVSPIQNLLEDAGAKFSPRDDIIIPSGISDIQTEYNFVRKTVGLTDFSHMQIFRFRDEEAIYFLDEVLPANITNIRYGRILHTFLSDSDGHLLSDVYVANNDDDDIFVICENCVSREIVADCFKTANVNDIPMEDVSGQFGLFSLDGPQSWAVMQDIFSPDILGMPYLSIEPHEFEGSEVFLLRVGKTAEFGYMILVPVTMAADVWRKIQTAAESHSGGICGLDVFDILKLDGRFFNINCEGRILKDPLPIGLQWMIDLEKDSFLGSEAILSRRNKGLNQKLITIKPESQGSPLAVGTKINLDDETVGEVVTASYSYTLDCQLALVLFNIEYAYAGLTFTAKTTDGDIPVRTISMPPFIPESLHIRLDEL